MQIVGDLMVGFKWIGEITDQRGPERFVLGAEESYGFLAGSHAREDAAVASMLLAEVSACAKAQGQSLQEKLDELFRLFGAHAEKQFSVVLPGAEGMGRMKALMAAFRSQPPESVAGMKVVGIRDYVKGTQCVPGQKSTPLNSPRATW